MYYSQSQTSYLSHSSTSQTYIDTGEGSYAVTTNIPNQMKFISPKLGVSFSYLSMVAHTPILTKEEGDEVYIYPNYHYQGFDYRQEPFVQVFQKNAQDDLATAIKKTILQGYSLKDCLVTPIRPAGYSSTYEVASITVPVPYGPDMPSYLEAVKKCPANYTPTNYLAYFILDKVHSNKFVFFKIGQQPIMASNRQTVDQTLRFLP